MPIDYLHLLNCVCIYYVAKQKDCWDAGSYIEIPATRLTADSWSQIVTDIYNRPSPMKPYYYIHNQNNSTNNEMLPTDPIKEVSDLGMPDGTDLGGLYKVTSNGYAETTVGSDKYYSFNGNIYTTTGTFDPANPGQALSGESLTAAIAAISGTDATTVMVYPDPIDTVAKENTEGSNFQRTFKLDLDGDGTAETNVSLVEKPIGLRAGNTSNVRMEIRYGKLGFLIFS